MKQESDEPDRIGEDFETEDGERWLEEQPLPTDPAGGHSLTQPGLSKKPSKVGTGNPKGASPGIDDEEASSKYKHSKKPSKAGP
jgi:hypothetical protein